MRVKTDGTQITKILLSEEDRKKAEGRTDAMSMVYKTLTNKILAFEFVKPPLEDKKKQKKKGKEGKREGKREYRGRGRRDREQEKADNKPKEETKEEVAAA